MPNKTKPLCLFVVLIALSYVSLLPIQSVAAEKKVVATTVTVGEMCGGCVKRITAHFDKIKEVSKVKCDINAKTVMLIPAKDVNLSPKKVWETLESIGKKPSKLVGPGGTFTSKPK